MFTLRSFILAFGLAAPFGVALAGDRGAQAPHLGKAMTANDIAKWNKTIFLDGHGLPPGQGTAQQGRSLYAERCASCHGGHGEGATAEELVGEPKPPTPDNPSKAIGPYWPFATTIFDFISRSMPPASPGSLTAGQTYALTAYLLAENKIISESDIIDAETLPKIQMPNRNGFVWIDVKK